MSIIDFIDRTMGAKSRLNVRWAKLIANMAGAGLGRATSLISTVLMVPLAVSGLGSQSYGTFAVILSATTFFTYADLGLGLAVVSRIAGLTKERSTEAHGVINRVFSMLLLASACAVSISLAVLVLICYKTGTLANSMAWIIALCSISAGIPAGLAQRVMFARSRNAEGAVWMSVSRALSLIGVFISSRIHASLSFYVLSVLTIPTVLAWVNLFYLYQWRERALFPRQVRFQLTGLRSDLKEGIRFTVLQLSVYAETGFDIVLIRTIIGVSSVAAYDVSFRLFNYVPALLSIATAPLWPAIAEAVSSGDRAWIDRVRDRAFVVTALVASSVSIFILLCRRSIIKEWTGHDLGVDFAIAVGIGLYVVASSLTQVQASIITGLGMVRKLVWAQSSLLLLLVPIKILCVKYWGLTGMIWCTVALYVPRLVILGRLMAASGG